MEGRIASDASICDNHVNRAKIGLDLGNPGRRFIVIGDIPFVGLDAGFSGESGSGFVIAGIGCGDTKTVGLQFLGNCFANSAAAAGD